MAKSASIANYLSRAEELRTLHQNGELDAEAEEQARQELAQMIPRDERGRLLAGGYPLGKKKGVQNRVVVLQAQIEEAVRNAVSPNDIRDVVAKMVDLSKAGNEKAAKIIMDAFMAKPRHVQEDVSSGASQIQIVINNTSEEGVSITGESNEDGVQPARNAGS